MKTVVFGFQARFVPLVESGAKRQTIRALRKDGRYPQPGYFAHCYAALRTRYARLVRRGVVTHVARVEMGFAAGTIAIDGALLDAGACRILAIQDGFESAEQMLAWFATHAGATADRFCGYLTRWEPI